MKPSGSRLTAWLVLVIAGCAAQGKEIRTVPSEGLQAAPAPGYLQLKLALYNRKGMVQRIHLRFAPGDDSYNYLKAGQVYIGLFHDAALVEKGKVLVARECRRLSGISKPVTLAEAELRPEDAAAFMEQLVKGEAVKTTFASPDSIGKMTFACSEPEGTAWRGEDEFKTPEEVGVQTAWLYDEAMGIGEAAVAGMKK